MVVPWGTFCFDKGGLREPTCLLDGPCSYLIVVLHRIRKMSITFLWSGNNFKRRYHLCSWKSLARPKHYGGWGLRNIFVFYRALASNTLWRALMKPGIWQRVLKDKYFLHGSVLTWLRSTDSVYSYGSQSWKNI
jgi:hypothetical protein